MTITKNEQEKLNEQNEASKERPDNKTTVELGYLLLHKDMPGTIPFSNAYYAIRRHELGERQPGIAESLHKLAEDESRETGCIVSYHVSEDSIVFKVVTCSELNETRIACAIEDPFERATHPDEDPFGFEQER